MIFEKVKTEEWCAQRDDFRIFLAKLVSNVPQADCLAELNLCLG